MNVASHDGLVSDEFSSTHAIGHDLCAPGIASRTEHESVIEYDVEERQLSRPTPIQFENPFDYDAQRTKSL